MRTALGSFALLLLLCSCGASSAGCRSIDAALLAAKIEVLEIRDAELGGEVLRGLAVVRWPASQKQPCLDTISWTDGLQSLSGVREGACVSVPDGSVEQSLRIEAAPGVLASALEGGGGKGSATLTGTLAGQQFDLSGSSRFRVSTADGMPVSLSGNGLLGSASLSVTGMLPPRGEIAVWVDNPTQTRLELGSGTYRVLSGAREVHRGSVQTPAVLEPGGRAQIRIAVASGDVLSLGLGSMTSGPGVPSISVSMPIVVGDRSLTVLVGVAPLKR